MDHKTVLVVEDDVETRESVCELLASMGHHAIEASSGMEALMIADEQRPDVVLLDLGLPDMTGHEVAVRLRSLAGERPLLIAAYTGRGGEGDARRSYAAGCDLHVVKPAGLLRLREVIDAASRPPAVDTSAWV